MEYLQEDQLWKRIELTLRGDGVESLFAAFDGASQLQAIIRESSACKLLKISDFCGEDKTISLDAFNDAIDASGERVLVLGIGEYAALTNDWRPLRPLWDKRKDGKKFIVPIFDGYVELQKMRERQAFRPSADPVVFLERTHSPWTYLRYKVSAPVKCATGMKAIMQKLETGYAGELPVRTGVELMPERGRSIENYGDLYLNLHPDENISPGMLTEGQWQKLLEQPEYQDDSFFGSANFLRLKQTEQTNPYLRAVLANTEKQADFKKNFIGLLLDYGPETDNFAELAKGRHDLAANLDRDDIRDYLFQLAKFPAVERIPYLSRRDEEEKLEILKCVSQKPELAARHGLENLAAYLEEYNITAAAAEDAARVLSSYFQTYKMAKLGNCAETPPGNGQQLINRLPARSKLVEDLKSPDTKLYWVDALGCEYLAFLQHHANKNRITMKTAIGRVKLPSITHLNRDFYDSWPYAKEVIRALDDIKHGHDLRFNRDEARKWPLHLVRELEVLENLVARLATELKTGKYKKIVIAADHGATRMPVIAGADLVWEMPEKGRYGGRCCPERAFCAELPPNIVRGDEEGWLVVADYARFGGSHQASVEVHGGSALEEAIVPILEFSVGKKVLPRIQLLTGGEIGIRPDQKHIQIEIISDMAIEEPGLHLGEHIYPLTLTGENRYVAEIPVAGLGSSNEGIVFAGADRLSPVLTFKISRGIKANDGMDDFFS